MTDQIIKTVELKAPIERVWKALTDHREFGSWFGVKLDRPFEIDAKARGHITNPGYEHVVWEATIVAMDQLRRFAFTWHPFAVDPAVDYSGEIPTLVEFILEPNEAIISEAGELSWMGASIQMTTHTQMAGGGGFFGAIRRVAGGGSLFMTEYRAYGAAGELAFATKVPGHITPVPVGNGNEYLVHRHGFLCATPEVQIGVGFQQSLGAGIFGGDGFRLQHIGGGGTAWIELSGEVITKDLRAGETLRVHPGHVGAFQTSVSFQIARIPGISNMIFGGDGLFVHHQCRG